MEFKEALQEILNEREISVQDLARKTNIDDSILYDYLHGCMPSIKYAVALASFFDCSVSYLIGITEEREEGRYLNEFDITLFSYRYDKLLKENKTTHFRVCKETELNYSSHYGWQRGAIPSMSSLIIIADYFCVSIDYLIGRKER